MEERKFISPFENSPYKDELIVSDCSDPYAEIFEEVPPFAIDPDTKKFINDSSQPKLISKGKINIQERIDSFGREVDIYSILERFAYGEDESLLKARKCEYGDISELPNDLNGYANYVDAHFKNLKDMNPDLAKKIFDENYSPEDIEKEAIKIYQMRLEDFEKQNQNEKKEVEK